MISVAVIAVGCALMAEGLTKEELGCMAAGALFAWLGIAIHFRRPVFGAIVYPLIGAAVLLATIGVFGMAFEMMRLG